MVSEKLAEEGLLLLHSLYYGALFMAGYDVLRIFRRLVRHSYFAVGVEDFFYWFAVGAGSFGFLYRENDGTIRWFVLAGIGLGMLLFAKGISRFTVPAVSWLLKKILWVPARILRGILTPVRKLGGIIRKKVTKRLKKEENCSTMKLISPFSRREADGTKKKTEKKRFS